MWHTERVEGCFCNAPENRLNRVICAGSVLHQSCLGCGFLQATAAVSYIGSTVERERALWAVFPNMSTFIALPKWVCVH